MPWAVGTKREALSALGVGLQEWLHLEAQEAGQPGRWLGGQPGVNPGRGPGVGFVASQTAQER